MKLEDRKDVQDFIKNKICSLLYELKQEHRDKFKLIYPSWPNKMTPNQLANAIDLCERTMKKIEKENDKRKNKC
jgi:DNA-binding XRE family transcriptional regulator